MLKNKYIQLHNVWQSAIKGGKGSIYPPRASLLAQMVKNLPAMQDTWVWFLGWEDSLEKGMVTHSNILVWLPGKPAGQGNLVSCSPWGLKESGTTEQLMLSLFKVLKLRLKWTLMHIRQVLLGKQNAKAWWRCWDQVSSWEISHDHFIFFFIPGFKCLLHLGMFSCHHLQFRAECKLMFFLLRFVLVRITFSCL